MNPSPYPRSTRWLVSVPALFLLVFLAIPTAVIVQRGASVGAFADIFANDGFRKIAWFTLWQTTLSTVLTVAFALPVTFILARFSFIGKRFLLAHHSTIPATHCRRWFCVVCPASRPNALHRICHHRRSYLFQHGSSRSFSNATMVTN